MNFESILKMNQRELKHAIAKKLRNMEYPVQQAQGFLYAEGDIPVLLVAHLDTVHRERVKNIFYSRTGELILSPEGIGGDDRAGVYMILKIIQNYRCHVLFCEDEETGGHGARAFTKSQIEPEVNYIVEMDRKGVDDAVFYNCDNSEFTNFICGFGFNKEYGSFSDISIIAPHFGIAAVNISAGYYNAHTKQEYINLTEMQHNVDRISRMVQTKTSLFEYVERSFKGYFEQMCLEPTTLFDLTEDGEKTKRLMPLPESAYLLINGYQVESGGSYLIDSYGTVYDYLDGLDVAVLSENSVAYSAAGIPLRFNDKAARKVTVIDLETATEMLKGA